MFRCNAINPNSEIRKKLPGFLVLLCLVCSNRFFPQHAAEPKSLSQFADEKEDLDSAGEMFGALAGDSVIYDKGGMKLEGWNEKFYEDGKLLHRGYYVNGKAIAFKNFFESGHCERSIENPDPEHCNVDVFFENGNTRLRVRYFNGKPQKLYEFYESGQQKYAQESDKDMKYLKLKKSWYLNGNIENSMGLTDQKNKKYEQKKYYANGRLKEEGGVILLSGTQDYVKNGNWNFYNDDGKNRRTERYSNGIKLNSKQ